ncbi:ATP-binding protein [Acinetobacter baumannii]|uniref:HD domain-containing protein n=1 Tax=Acinetobacter baumannii TaxID=470 RepID=UPI000D0BA2A4|nr:ATP-binding protein [Acinetobacter baumannii]MDH2582606.1 ATP-binding protein [Acinetobacter baumannii]PSE07593.1 ATP-binding protein [Acinetobacter baumannii]
MGTYSNITIENDQFYSLEKHFEIACNRHPHLKLLESQWRFDQELISKALQNINTIFPHYSRHDASHSKQIIVNIERMLGDKIKYLSATDTWLILESAYNHDIGMVITQKQIEDMNSKEFEEFVISLKEDEGNELHSFANRWLKEKAVLPKNAKAHSFFHNYIQLLAEWYRRKHPQNSANIVRNPLQEIGMDSPRNELLPSRLFRVVADICKAHGDNFDDVMKLPHAEAGMASEDCHPRYVACLIRMGDLLDVDDNRFCPVMLNMCGSNIPHLSHIHNEKHQSIRHLRIDSERIEVDSVCPNPDAYEVTHDWFSWLQQEYHNQTQSWDKIVPNKELGRLPTLTTPRVDIEEPYLILEKGKKPNFKINHDAVLGILRSTGLYTSKVDSIREILQNGVDATLQRIWSEDSRIVDEAKSPLDESIQSLYKQYPIEVKFQQKKDDIWTLEITDHGIGIDFDTLKFMLEVGGSRKNKSKIKTIKAMPKWFRPSGMFGIGLQSAYLLNDKFKIITKSIYTKETLKINFNKQKENIVIKKVNKNILTDFGTKFIIDIRIKNFPQRISLGWGESEIKRKLNEYDFTKSGSNLKDYEILNIKSSISDFFYESPIGSNLFAQIKKDDNYYFDKKTNILISGVCFKDIHSGSFETYFRGQIFNDLNLSGCINFCSAKIDFYGERADKFLTYNREKILVEAKNNAKKKVEQALRNYIKNKYEKIPEDEKPFASACYMRLCPFSEIETNILNEINKIPVFIDNKVVPLVELIHEIKESKIKNISVINHVNDSFSVENVVKNNAKDDIINLLLFLVTKQGMYYQIDNLNIYGCNYKFYNDDLMPITESYFKKILNFNISKGFYEIGCRKIFPAWGEFRKLSFSATIKWPDRFFYQDFRNEVLVLPYLFNQNLKIEDRFDNSEEFVTWVFENRKDKNVTLDEIRDLNNKLIEHLKQII